MPHTVQRIMRESIVLENELIRLWNDHSNMEDRILSYEYMFNKGSYTFLCKW